MADGAPLKYIDIKNMIRPGIQAMTPSSLAFMLSPETRGIPAVPQGFDARRLPFSDVSLALRDQRQNQLLNPRTNNPFSVFVGEQNLRRLKNR